MAGYSGSLFDPKGPGRFAASLSTITGAMGDVVAGVIQMGEKSSKALTSLSEQYDTLIEQAGQFNVVQGQDPGNQRQPSGAPTWNNPTPKPANHGNTGGERAPSQGPLAPGTMGGAAMAIGSAAAGAAQRFADANKSTVMQAAISGQQYGTWFGGGRNSYMTVPNVAGPGGQSQTAMTVGGQSDYVQSQRILALQMGVAPQSTNPNVPTSANTKMFGTALNTAVMMDPGQSRAGATAAFSGMYTGSSTQSFAAVGISVRSGGINADPYSIFEQIFQKTYPSSTLQAKLTQDDIANALTPGGPLEKNFESLGLDPGGDLFTQFEEYMYSRQYWVQQHPGKALPSGAELQRAFKLDQGPAAAALRKSSALTQAKSLLVPSQATVDQKLDTAATAIAQLAVAFGGSGLGKGLVGGSGGLLGGASKFLGPLLGAGSALGPLLLAAQKITSATSGGGGGGGGPTAGINSTSLTYGGASTGTGASLSPQQARLLSDTPTDQSTKSPIGLGAILASARGVLPTGSPDWYGTLEGPAAATATTFVNYQMTEVASGLKGVTDNGTTTSKSTTPATTPSTDTTTTTPSDPGAPLPAGGTPAQNKVLGQAMAANMGWTGQNWTDLLALWMQESGWNQKAYNKSSGATGIPQSLPASKMASAGSDYLTNPATQIKWGLGYIKDRYGDPSTAMAHERKYNWYDRGSYNVDRTQLAMLHKGERVVPAADNYSVAGRYRRMNSPGSGDVQVHKNFSSGAISLAVPPHPSSSDFDVLAQQFAAAVTKVSATRASRVS